MTTIQTGFNPGYAEEEPTPEQVSGWAGDAILEFGAPWCGFCQAAQPAIREVLDTYSGLKHVKVYDGKGKPLGRFFRVKLWPTLILLRDGREVGRSVRPSSAQEIRQLVAQSE